jgi:hypothetical protein
MAQDEMTLLQDWVKERALSVAEAAASEKDRYRRRVLAQEALRLRRASRRGTVVLTKVEPE